MKTYSIKRIASQNLFRIEIDSNSINVNFEEKDYIFHYKLQEQTLIIEVAELSSSEEIFHVAVEILLNEYADVININLNNKIICSRETFYQRPGIWNIPTDESFPIENWIQTNDVTHPNRPKMSAGQKLYSRYISNIEATVEFRVITINDLDIFHEWHNKSRVASFWELALSKKEHLAYITKGLNDPHQTPVIAEINGVPVGYFELYWVKEDRLGPYYESEAYDRGFHLLIGNDNFLGFNNTDALLKSFSHFIFLDDPRTRRIMGEPRHDNQKLLKYVLSFKSWRKIKEFDFPHKRAVLLECNRELFFKGNYL